MQNPRFRIFRILTIVAAFGVLAAVLAACGGGESSTEHKVWFGNLEDGAEITSPFEVTMKAQNLVVEPAASGIRDGHGHFHILVDVPLPEAPDPIPFDERHIHYGTGDSVATLELPPGDHTLTLQFARGNHVPYDPQIAQTIRITVVE